MEQPASAGWGMTTWDGSLYQFACSVDEEYQSAGRRVLCSGIESPP
ncbi:MAG: hypothetical protein LUE22_09240 [Oscillospiraceae bacterium]|nr:hypothetical protein [Oscillospiraceae bacterium]